MSRPTTWIWALLTLWPRQLKNLKAGLSSCHMISVSFSLFSLSSRVIIWFSGTYTGLISQVAEELWEVADKTIHNLTKQEIDIVGYKRNLIKQSKLK